MTQEFRENIKGLRKKMRFPNFEENTKIKNNLVQSYAKIIDVYGTNSNIDWIRTEENYKDTIKQIEQATNNRIPISQKPIQFLYGKSIIVFKSN